MNTEKFISSLRRDLIKQIDLEYQQGFQNYFKEPVRNYGVRSKPLKEIANKYYLQLKPLSKKEVFAICEKLLGLDYYELSSLAFNFCFRRKQEFTIQDFKLFTKWLKQYVSNWGYCDTFCTYSFGHLLWQFPELITETDKWVTSSNRWLKRAVAVILIYPLKKSVDTPKKFNLFLQRSFWVSNKLIKDQDDLVQKGYGWLLKEASNLDQKVIFDYVMKKKQIMPRTALRYAIEKMPQNLKQQAMVRN